jgi:hypothetical protein
VIKMPTLQQTTKKTILIVLAITSVIIFAICEIKPDINPYQSLTDMQNKRHYMWKTCNRLERTFAIVFIHRSSDI